MKSSLEDLVKSLFGKHKSTSDIGKNEKDGLRALDDAEETASTYGT